MKKQRLEQLTNEMIEILITEKDDNKEGTCLIVKHYQDEILRSTINKVRAATSAEWYFNKKMNDDIARDEVYASFYEAALELTEYMDIEDISIDNKELLSEIVKVVINKSKKNLIPASKKNRDGSIIGMYETYLSPLNESDDEMANSPLEDILAGSIVANSEEENERKNHFLRWFDANKYKILTKKQIDFIDGGHIAEDKTNAYKMRKRISKRVSRAYNEQYGDVSPRIAVLKGQEKILEEILDAKSFRAAYDKYKDEDFIIDAISEYVALDYLRAFNKGNNNPDTIRAMRVALYKRLGEVINMIEAVK